jgi:competence protein ComEC
VSGLNVTAVTGATMFLVLRLLALFPALALRVRLPIVAAFASAVAAVGYTWLTGGQVPTVRACIAALLVLLALSLGREALTLRLVAFGALIVLLLWPESLVGPSFQLTFVAVTTIVALHEHPRVRRWFRKRDEHWLRHLAREGVSLLFTGTVIELALMPVALYHFHKSGVYGAVANIVAIPLTTFVAMPLEALALLFDLVHLGGPFWWLVGKSLALLLWIAHATAGMPGANASLPVMPLGAYALMMTGGSWLALWRTRARWLGALPFVAGALWALLTPAPDLLVTGDGRHVALRTADGGMAILRERAGDYTRQMLGENGGVEGELPAFDDLPDARCSADICMVERKARGRTWHILATRSGFPLPWQQLVDLCSSADIVVSERVLPEKCQPHWLKLDRRVLARTGGIAIALPVGAVRTVRGKHHPWDDPPKIAPPFDRPALHGRH